MIMQPFRPVTTPGEPGWYVASPFNRPFVNDTAIGSYYGPFPDKQVAQIVAAVMGAKAPELFGDTDLKLAGELPAEMGYASVVFQHPSRAPYPKGMTWEKIETQLEDQFAAKPERTKTLRVWMTERLSATNLLVLDDPSLEPDIVAYPEGGEWAVKLIYHPPGAYSIGESEGLTPDAEKMLQRKVEEWTYRYYAGAGVANVPPFTDPVGTRLLG